MNNLEHFCEEIDASIFSGDALYTSRDILAEYVKRWQRAIDEHDEFEKENSDENGA